MTTLKYVGICPRCKESIQFSYPEDKEQCPYCELEGFWDCDVDDNCEFIWYDEYFKGDLKPFEGIINSFMISVAIVIFFIFIFWLI